MSDVDRQQIQKTKFKAALVAFICCCHIAFHLIKSPWFLTLLSTLLNLVTELVPDSHNTVRKWTIKSFKKNKVKVKTRLHKARSNIHLSFDLWSSGNYFSFNAIIAHFINEDYSVKTVLISFRDLKGPHTGENIAESVRTVYEEYNIISKVSYLVLDNAKNNDTYV
jgi:hypothetical protein